MGVPVNITDLSTSAASNSPAGSDSIGTSLDDYLRAGFGFTAQLFNTATVYASTVGGTANAITLTPSPALTAYQAGQKIVFKATGNSSSGVTIAVSGLAAKNAYQSDGTTQIGNGDISSGKYYTFVYDSTLNSSAGGFLYDGAVGGTSFPTISVAGTATFKNNLTIGVGPLSAGSWIDMPTTGASGIGSGGAGANAWLAYCSGNNFWFNGSLTGDVAIRNANTKRLLIGIDNGSGTANPSITVTGTQTSISASVIGVPVYNYIAGLLSTSQTFTNNTTASMTITSGQAADSTNAVMLAGGSFSWNVTNGNAVNGYQGGTTLPNSSTIHFFICNGTSGYGSFASTSLSPTLPTGYTTYFRRIFSLNTNGSGVLLAGTPIETHGGAIVYMLSTQILDINVSNLISASRTLFALTVPSGIKLKPLYRANTTTTNVGILFMSPDETDVAAGSVSWSTAPGSDMYAAAGPAGVSWPRDGLLITNTSAQIAARGSTGTTTNLSFVTRGFEDFRRS